MGIFLAGHGGENRTYKFKNLGGLCHEFFFLPLVCYLYYQSTPSRPLISQPKIILNLLRRKNLLLSFLLLRYRTISVHRSRKKIKKISKFIKHGRHILVLEVFLLMRRVFFLTVPLAQKDIIRRLETKFFFYDF